MDQAAKGPPLGLSRARSSPAAPLPCWDINGTETPLQTSTFSCRNSRRGLGQPAGSL